MRVDTLEAYNVPADILSIWRTEVGAELLPVQEFLAGAVAGDSRLLWSED